MKKNIQHIIGCIITIILASILILRTGHVLDPAWSEDGLDVIKAFDLIEDNTLDVIVYGSSHAWKGCDTMVMCNEYNLRAYNYGCNWQAINTIRLFLEDSLRTQNPKVVCIEVGLVDNLERDTNMDGQIYYTRAMRNFDGKRKYLKQCFGDDIERYVSYYIPLVMFHDNWTSINYENYLLQGPERWIEAKGYCGSTNVFECSIPDYNTFSQKELNKDCVEVLQSMVDICHENNIDIIFYTCPYMGEYSYGDFMTKFAEDNGCEYLDLFKYAEEIELNGDLDFRDSDHLNNNGSTKVASFLAEYIIDNYDIK